VHSSRDAKFVSLVDGSLGISNIKPNAMISPHANLRFHNASVPQQQGKAPVISMSNTPQAFFSFGTTLPNRGTPPNKSSSFGLPSPPLFQPGALRSPSSSQLGRPLVPNQITQPALQNLVQQRNQSATTSQKSQPARNLHFVECPHCGQNVPFVGSNFFMHINKCDPELANSVVCLVQLRDSFILVISTASIN
jgi:hypothetical protein